MPSSPAATGVARPGRRCRQALRRKVRASFDPAASRRAGKDPDAGQKEQHAEDDAPHRPAAADGPTRRLGVSTWVSPCTSTDTTASPLTLTT